MQETGIPIANADIAAAFEQVADLLALQGADPFRIRAYRRAARTVGGLDVDLAAIVAAGRPLPKLPGIGEDLDARIREFAGSGRLALLERLRREVPHGLDELLSVPGLGPARVRALHAALHLHTPGQLLRAAREGRLRGLPGFGARTEARIAAAIEQRLVDTRRHPLAIAAPQADALLDRLRGLPGVRSAQAAGSLRRCRDTVGDLDLLVVADEGGEVGRRLAGMPEVAQVLSQGATRTSVVLRSGMQVDLCVVPPGCQGAALLYLTGSKAHGIRLRRRAVALGLKLNEYGLFRGRRRVAGATEAEVFAALGLPWIPPELREDRGEIEAAERGALPSLVERGDLRGDLHVHTDWSDGAAGIAEMAAAARVRGLSYLAITDHSRRLGVAHGLDATRLARQCDAIAACRAQVAGIALLTGIEVDILDDGGLDLPDPVLAPLDVVIAAVHSGFERSRARQTERILAALEHPRVRILAHPGGRLIGRREPYEVDMLAVARKCHARGIALELNAHPERLDLTEMHCRLAKGEGALVAIGSDAHAPGDFDHLALGIGQARRGWLERTDVVNTRPLAQLRHWLQRPAGTR